MKIFKRFKIIGSMPSVQKLSAQKSPKIKDPFMEMIQKEKNVKTLRGYYGDQPHKLPLVSLKQEKIAELARRKESFKMEKNIFKVRKAITSKYPGGISSINDPKKLAQAKRLEIKAFTSAQKSAKRFQSKLSEKAGVGVRRFGSKAVKRDYMPDEKARELGFPERESAFKYQYAKANAPAPKIKKLKQLLYNPKYKKQKKVIEARISSLEYQQKLSNIYSETKGIRYSSPSTKGKTMYMNDNSPTFLTDTAKKSRLERLFSGKSYIKRKK